MGVEKKVDSYSFGQGQVGHTHNEVDQRFSTACQLLSGRCRCESLECADDFFRVMQQLRPIRGRSQDARVLTASRDWRRFFEEHLGNLTGLLKGHGECKYTKLRGEEAQHSWVFVRRDALDREDPENISGLVINNVWGTDAHPGDVILLTRLYISDPKIHCVEVFLPAEKLALLPRGGTDYMSDRNALTKRQCDEFMKTADKLETVPLNMKRGAEYLRTLVRESRIIASGGDPPPPWQLPPLGWVAGRTEDGIDPSLCPVDDADADLACLVDTHLKATLPQMISIHPNVLNHVSGRKPKLSHVPNGHGAPTGDLEPSAPPGAGILADPEAKANAKAKAKAKAKAQGMKRPASADPESGGIHVAPSDAAPPPERHRRAPRGNRRRLDFAEPPEPDARLGCGTCRKSWRGCVGCRKKVGMIVRDGRWMWPLPLECPLD